jgi:hypothetical protein
MSALSIYFLKDLVGIIAEFDGLRLASTSEDVEGVITQTVERVWREFRENRDTQIKHPAIHAWIHENGVPSVETRHQFSQRVRGASAELSEELGAEFGRCTNAALDVVEEQYGADSLTPAYFQALETAFHQAENDYNLRLIWPRLCDALLAVQADAIKQKALAMLEEEAGQPVSEELLSPEVLRNAATAMQQTSPPLLRRLLPADFKRNIQQVKDFLADSNRKPDLDAIRVLDLSGLGLTIIPLEIAALPFPDLEGLYLYENRLDALPEGFLQNVLNLQDLQIDPSCSIPRGFRVMPAPPAHPHPPHDPFPFPIPTPPSAPYPYSLPQESKRS